VRRLEARDVRARKLAQLALICARALQNKGVRRFTPLFINPFDFFSI
jgi:hypothetical protein